MCGFDTHSSPMLLKKMLGLVYKCCSEIKPDCVPVNACTPYAVIYIVLVCYDGMVFFICRGLPMFTLVGKHGKV